MKLFIGLVMLIASLSFVQAKELTLREAKGVTFEIYPVKEGAKGEKGCHLYYGGCLIFTSGKPVAKFTDFKYETFQAEKPGINIYLSDHDLADIKKATEANLNGQLAIVYRGRILHAPKIRMVIDQNPSQLTFCNRRNFRVVKDSLEGKIIDDAVFQRKFDCNCAEK